MTRARALKHVIRARAARTGERYTTARRHVLNSLDAPAPTQDSKADVPARSASSRRPNATSDARFLEKTGHGLDHWFAVLDRFGAIEKGHTAAARHLNKDHGVDGWWAQGITVAYERARGVRTVNQRCDGWYEVSVSKMLATDTAGIVRALGNRRWRAQLAGHEAEALTTFAKALDSPSSKGFVVRPDGQARYRYKWGETIVQLHVWPKGECKVSLVATNTKLRTASMVDERRAAWRHALNAIASKFAAPAARRRA